MISVVQNAYVEMIVELREYFRVIILLVDYLNCTLALPAHLNFLLCTKVNVFWLNEHLQLL